MNRTKTSCKNNRGRLPALFTLVFFAIFLPLNIGYAQTIFIDDKAAFTAALTANPLSTVTDSGGTFGPDPAPAANIPKVTRSGNINGEAFTLDIYDINFSNAPTGTITPGVVGGDIDQLDNLNTESPASQGGAVGLASWGIDTLGGKNATRNAFLFDFTATPGNKGVGNFGFTALDIESGTLVGRQVANYRVYKSGVLVDSGVINWPGTDGDGERHFFGYVATSEANFFDQIVILVGDDDVAGDGTGRRERLAGDFFGFGQGFIGTGGVETTKTATVSTSAGSDPLISDAEDTVTYTIAVKNTGNVTLTSVNIASDTLKRDDNTALVLTSGPTFVSNSGASAIGTLVPDEIATFTATYQLVQADIDAGGINNSATATATPPTGPAITDVSDDGDDSDGNTTDDPTLTPLSATAALDVVKTATTSTSAGIDATKPDAGDLVTYTITIKNTGSLTLNTVLVSNDNLLRNDNTTLSLTSGPTFVSNSGASAQGNLVPGETATFTATYLLVQADVDAGGISNSATGVGTPASGIQVSDVSNDGDNNDGNTSDDPTGTTLEPPIVPVPPVITDLVVTKTAGRDTVRIGEAVSFTITVTNRDANARSGINFIDDIPAGLLYLPNSARIAGVAVEPSIVGNQLIWAGQTIGANSSVAIVLTMRVSAAAKVFEYVNGALVLDQDTGAPISNVATAKVRRELEHVFDCGDIVGKVFNDKNQNGYQNKGEYGLPGVRVATVKGVLITTDKHGRYSVPCASVPDAKIGSNFILKLDVRTLPTGYHLTTENPRVVRLTRGKASKLNFGVSQNRIIDIKLAANAFNKGSATPRRELSKGIHGLINQLSGNSSMLRITYVANRAEAKIASKRLKVVKKLVERLWRQEIGVGRLPVETRIVRLR